MMNKGAGGVKHIALLFILETIAGNLFLPEASSVVSSLPDIVK